MQIVNVLKLLHVHDIDHITSKLQTETFEGRRSEIVCQTPALSVTNKIPRII